MENNQIPATNVVAAALTGTDINAPVYEIHVAHKTLGHETFRVNLEVAVERIFSHFQTNKLWAVINDGIFKTAAKFTGGAEDNEIIEKDKIRLRDLLSSLTTVDVAFPGRFVTPTVQVVGRVIGGRS